MTHQLRGSDVLFKGHGLGNDYLVVVAGDAWPLTPTAVETVCDRWRGVGSDGIVVLLDSNPPFRLRMFNPDGSEFERSGNGLRILGAYLASEGLVGDAPFDVEVGGDHVRLTVHKRNESGVYDVFVEMGAARFDDEAVGIDRVQLDSEGRVHIVGDGDTDGGRTLEFHAVSIGNPHAVVFGEPMTREQLRVVGSTLTTHPAFLRGVNVQLAQSLGPGVVEALIWERGVGWTSASGTSACAVALAAVRTGRQEAGAIEVRMEGGTLYVEVTPSFDVILRGPAQEVFRGTMTVGFLAGLNAP